MRGLLLKERSPELAVCWHRMRFISSTKPGGVVLERLQHREDHAQGNCDPNRSAASEDASRLDGMFAQFSTKRDSPKASQVDALSGRIRQRETQGSAPTLLRLMTRCAFVFVSGYEDACLNEVASTLAPV